MEPWVMGATLLVAALLAALTTGLWIPVALGMVGLLFIVFIDGLGGLSSVGSLIFNNVNSLTLTAVPLFVLMGELILKSNLMQEFYRALSAWLRWLPGGLLHSNIAASGIMSAVTGSSVATAAAVGSSAIPVLKGHGYQRKQVYGTLAAGGTLGILIPPSIIMIVYGALTQQSVAALFVAAILPGVMLVLAFMIYILLTHVRSGASPVSEPTSWREKLTGLRHLFPVCLLLFLVIYAIYTGIMTPSEAGAMGAIATALLVAAYRRLSWGVVTAAVRSTVNLSGMVLAIVMSASIYSYALVRGGINRGVTGWIADSGFPVLGVLLATALLILVLGMFIDGISIIYLALPVLIPVMVALDVNLIWFGVFVTVLIEVGLITPPLGLNLFVIKGIDPQARMSEITLGVTPYLMIMLGLVGVLLAWPDLALALAGTSDAR